MLQDTQKLLPFSLFLEPLSVRPASSCLGCLDLCEAKHIIVRQQPLIQLLNAVLLLHGTQFSKLITQLHHQVLRLLCAQSILLAVGISYFLNRFACTGITMGVSCVSLHDPRFNCSGVVSLTRFALPLRVILATQELLNNLKGCACAEGAGVNITSM